MVHVLGHPNSIEDVKYLCDKYNITLIEDSCEALGSVYKGTKLGATTFASSFSMYYGHHISTIEGGMVTTNDRKLFEIMMSIRSHGWVRDLPAETQKTWCSHFNINEFRKFYSFFYLGFNLRSTDLNAFLGLQQLKKLDELVKKREENFYLYKKLLNQYYAQNSNNDVLSSFAYGTLVDNPLDVYYYLRKNGIECRPLICGSMGSQPFWIKKFGKTKLDIADKIHSNGVYLPNHGKLNKERIEFVCSTFKEIARPYSI